MNFRSRAKIERVPEGILIKPAEPTRGTESTFGAKGKASPSERAMAPGCDNPLRMPHRGWRVLRRTMQRLFGKGGQ
jgi:hypothetical protein